MGRAAAGRWAPFTCIGYQDYLQVQGLSHLRRGWPVTFRRAFFPSVCPLKTEQSVALLLSQQNFMTALRMMRVAGARRALAQPCIKQIKAVARRGNYGCMRR